ncbi:MAG: hypothetical protein NC355_02090 [Blautia sp.]|nr:hypothetical protein [Blautia sp.]
MKQGRMLFFYILLALTLLAGIFLPGKMNTARMYADTNQVLRVPEQYLPSGSVMARSASENLTKEERLRLIRGEWDSVTTRAEDFEMLWSASEAVTAARQELKRLYDKGEYPVDLSGYGNWYTWTAVPYKAVDTTFGTYSAYYWVITFEKYDGTDAREICILENGNIFEK